MGNELNSYRLFLGNYSGNVGKDALLYHNNTVFSTKDKDNDNCLDKCAQLRKGETWAAGRAGPTKDSSELQICCCCSGRAVPFALRPPISPSLGRTSPAY